MTALKNSRQIGFSQIEVGVSMTVASEVVGGAVVPFIEVKAEVRPKRRRTQLRKLAIAVNIFIDVAATGLLVLYFGFYAEGKPMYELTRLVYGEARGEPLEGQKAVLATVMHRTVSMYGQFSVAGMDYIVHEPNGNTCMYVAMCDSIEEKMSSQLGIIIMMRTTLWFLDFQMGLLQKNDPSKGAEWFCAGDACTTDTFFKNYKKKGLVKTVKIGNHQFFRRALPLERLPTDSAPIPKAKPRLASK